MAALFKLSHFNGFLHSPMQNRWLRCAFVMFASLLSFHVPCCAGETLDNGASETVVAFAGDTVILPCHITLMSDIPTVEWSKEGLDPNIIFLYRDGCETFEMKNPLFQFRANLFMNEVKNGNISLRLSNIQLTDAGKYQCKILRNRSPHVVKTLELFVGAVSEPKLTVVPGVGDGVTLQCETNCWFPVPNITFLDDQGNVIRAENKKRSQDSNGCFTITSRVTVQTTTNRVTCRVHQPNINKTRETEKCIPSTCDSSTKCLKSCTVPAIITSLVTIVALGLFAFLRKKCNCAERKMSGQSSDQCTKCRNAASVNLRNQANSGNVITEPLQKRKELEQALCHKDERIRQLTEELNNLRSRQGPVLQHSQPTIGNSPSRSSPHMSEPINQVPHRFPLDNNRKPPASTSNNQPKAGTSSKTKGSKSDISKQNPALGPPVQTNSHNHISALLTNNGALSSSSSSASTSEENHLVRSKSESRPHSSGAKIQRRYTISAPSHNRFSILAHLAEDSEMLLQHE